MGFWEGFGKYVGIQGVLAIAFGLGLVIAPFAHVELPELYDKALMFVLGLYAGKNGLNAIKAARGG